MQFMNETVVSTDAQCRVQYSQPRLLSLGTISALTAAGSGGQNENASAGGCAGQKVKNNNCP